MASDPKKRLGDLLSGPLLAFGLITALAMGLAMGLTGLSVGWADPAAAHTGLVAANPAEDAQLAQLPTAVVLTFNERLQAPGYLVLTAPDGTRVVQGEAEIAGPELRADLSGVSEAPGEWTVAFRVVSQDGHPVTGSYRFQLTGSSDAPTVSPSAATPGTPTGSPTTAPATAPATSAPVTPASEASGKAAKQTWWQEHATHVWWGVGLLILAAGLLVVERRRHR